MYGSIGFYDWQNILHLLEVVAWVAIVDIGLVFLMQTKSKLFTKRNKQIVLLIFAVWAVASIGMATIGVYDYFTHQRKTMINAIEMQQPPYGR